MRKAYLITAYDNFQHLKRLIDSLDSDNSFFFIHIDKKIKHPFSYPKKKNVVVINNNIKVYWGSFSFIEAVLRLINKAGEYGKFDYFILTSGTDYPIRSNEYIDEFLKKNNGKEFINISKMPANDKPFHRVWYYYLETENNFKPISLIKRTINRLMRVLHIKRALPKEYSSYTLYGGSNWWALSGKCIEYIMDFVEKNPKFVKFYKHTLIPEEMFFHTIIGNSSFMKSVVNSFVYAEWRLPNQAHPFLINDQHLKIFEKGEYISPYGKKETSILFARKFSDKHAPLLDIIDKKFRK